MNAKYGPRDPRNLTPQLIGHEGWRVEVVNEDGRKYRFLVGRSMGWQPCHLELKRKDSEGGCPAEAEYRSVKRVSDVCSHLYREWWK